MAQKEQIRICSQKTWGMVYPCAVARPPCEWRLRDKRDKVNAPREVVPGGSQGYTRAREKRRRKKEELCAHAVLPISQACMAFDSLLGRGEGGNGMMHGRLPTHVHITAAGRQGPGQRTPEAFVCFSLSLLRFLPGCVNCDTCMPFFPSDPTQHLAFYGQCGQGAWGDLGGGGVEEFPYGDDRNGGCRATAGCKIRYSGHQTRMAETQPRGGWDLSLALPSADLRRATIIVVAARPASV